MRTKRKRNRPDQAKHSNEKSQAFAQQPFRALLEDDRDFVKTSEPVSSSSPHGNAPEETEEDLFQRAMENVVPLKGNRNKILRSPVSKEKPHDELSDQSAKAREYLSHLVREPAAWDISFSDEYMEGSVSGVGPKIMKRLRRGEFSIQDHVDLHGLTKKEAEPAVNSFIIKSYQKDLRCVLIVHGRGLGSADRQPAIKNELPVWFRRGALKRIVLAFATAQPYDGGAGAVYVLLRKR
ncbi:MAG: Smr/MutS family protein [Deltaproteobacteria bacterium]|nr:Smr/MutS family protein [Deltaproteobacteria bacterium]MBW2341689.1 Smr/MutS family protein [Deltaproteobacteria bacterium]